MPHCTRGRAGAVRALTGDVGLVLLEERLCERRGVRLRVEGEGREGSRARLGPGEQLIPQAGDGGARA